MLLSADYICPGQFYNQMDYSCYLACTQILNIYKCSHNMDAQSQGYAGVLVNKHTPSNLLMVFDLFHDAGGRKLQRKQPVRCYWL